MPWHALSALVLSVGVSVSLVLLVVTQIVDNGHLTPDESTVIATVLGAGVGAVATYMGERGSRKDD